MKNDSDKNLLAIGGFAKQGVGYFISNSGKIIAAITLLVATLVTFANITFADFRGEAFTVALTVMLISSYMMYFSLEDAGEKEGEESELYKEALSKFLAVRGKIGADRIDDLRSFCLSYAAQELNYRRSNYLCENGLSENEYNSFKNGEKFSYRAARCFNRAERMKAVNLTPSMLLSRSQNHFGSELTPPNIRKLTSTLLTLIPSTACTVFTISVILTAKNGLTISTVADGIMKLSALPIVGFKGFLDGYRYATEAKSTWLETKTRLLENFLDKREYAKN